MSQKGEDILNAVRLLEDYFCDGAIESLRYLSENYKREKKDYPDSNINELAFCVDRLTVEELKHIVLNSFYDFMDKLHLMIDPYTLPKDI